MYQYSDFGFTDYRYTNIPIVKSYPYAKFFGVGSPYASEAGLEDTDFEFRNVTICRGGAIHCTLSTNLCKKIPDKMQFSQENV